MDIYLLKYLKLFYNNNGLCKIFSKTIKLSEIFQFVNVNYKYIELILSSEKNSFTILQLVDTRGVHLLCNIPM